MSKETIWDKINKAGRYTLGGFLPGEVQKKMAEKHGENVNGYTLGSYLTELSGAAIMGAGMALFPPLGLVGVALIGDAIFSSMIKINRHMKTGEYCGHPITTIPYHTLVKPTEKMIGYLKGKINEEGKETLEPKFDR